MKLYYYYLLVKGLTTKNEKQVNKWLNLLLLLFLIFCALGSKESSPDSFN